jgi:hypothetical protein
MPLRWQTPVFVPCCRPLSACVGLRHLTRYQLSTWSRRYRHRGTATSAARIRKAVSEHAAGWAHRQAPVLEWLSLEIVPAIGYTPGSGSAQEGMRMLNITITRHLAPPSKGADTVAVAGLTIGGGPVALSGVAELRLGLRALFLTISEPLT